MTNSHAARKSELLHGRRQPGACAFATDVHNCNKHALLFHLLVNRQITIIYTLSVYLYNIYFISKKTEF